MVQILHATQNLEFTKPRRRRRRGQRQQKKNLYLTYESRDNLKSFTLFITAKTITKLNPEHSDKFEKEKKNSRRGPRSPAKAKFGHSTSLICRGRQRNVPRITTHVQSH